MISGTKHGYQPVAVYARRARDPLKDKLSEGGTGFFLLKVVHHSLILPYFPEFSWGMLGTNLSVKVDDLTWDTESQRLLLMDRKDFNQLGLGLDDLINAYVQTVLASIAIDKMCCRLMKSGTFDLDLFRSLNDDPALIAEVQL